MDQVHIQVHVYTPLSNKTFLHVHVGLRTVAMGYQSILVGDADVVVAAGQESMSQVKREKGRRLLLV